MIGIGSFIRHKAKDIVGRVYREGPYGFEIISHDNIPLGLNFDYLQKHWVECSEDHYRKSQILWKLKQ